MDTIFPFYILIGRVNDVIFVARVREVALQTEKYKSIGNDNPMRKARSFSRMQQALIAAQELGDEKLSVLQDILDRIEAKSRLLEDDFKNLGRLRIVTSLFFVLLDSFLLICNKCLYYCSADFGKEEQTQTENKEQQPPTNSTQTNNNTSLTNNERPSKRQRRTRNDAFSGLENNHNDSAPAEHVLRSQAPSSTSSGSVQKKSTTGELKLYKLNTVYNLFELKILVKNIQRF